MDTRRGLEVGLALGGRLVRVGVRVGVGVGVRVRVVDRRERAW